MIAVEGPDGAGKSTLVAHLADKFGLTVGQRGVADRDFLWKVTRQDTYRALAHAVSGKTPACVWDRLWISEYIYHDINPRRKCEFSLPETGYIRSVMDAVNCPMILCLPPYEVVRENARKVHQMEGVANALHEIYFRYREVPLPWPVNTVRYDYTGTLPHFTLDEIEYNVEEYLKGRKERQAWD